MTSDLIFVSYSRKEFYFTESLVLHLQRQSIDAWFDVQQLEPGIGWKTDIQDGLERCKALVLVASQSSLASPYVKAEVEAAQNAGKPIYVVLFEPVMLPAEMREPAALIDFTQGFDRGMGLLSSVISGQVAHHDPLPDDQSPLLPEGVAGLIKIMRRQEIIWLVLLVCFLIGLLRPIIFFVSDEYRLDPGYAPVMAFAPLMLSGVLIDLVTNRFLFRIASKVRRRESIPFRLWVKALDFRIMLLISFMIVTIAYAAMFRSFLFLLLLIPLVYIGARIVLSMSYANRIQVLLNPDVLRWCHLGNDAPFDWRLMVNQSVLPEGMEVDVQSKIVKSTDDNGTVTTSEIVTGVMLSVKGAKLVPKTFRLYSTPQISETTDQIRSILKQNAFHELNDDAYEPDYHILLLSPWMPIDVAQQLLKAHPQNTLPLLVSPADLSQLPSITTLQLIDFRKRYNPLLASALQYLHTQNMQQRSVYSIGVLPIRVSEAFPLREIRTLSRFVIYMATVCFIVGIIGMLSLISRTEVDLAFGLSTFAYLACLGFGVQIRRLDHDIRNLLPGAGARLKRWVTLSVMLISGIFYVGLQPQIGENSIYNFSIGSDFGWRLAVIAFVVTVGILIYIETERMIRRGILFAKRTLILGIPAVPPPPSALYVRNFAMMLVGVMIAYAIITMIEGDKAGKIRTFTELLRYGGVFLGVVIAGSVIALLTLGVSTSATFSNDDPVFAIGDAPSLRAHLKGSLRRTPTPFAGGK